MEVQQRQVRPIVWECTTNGAFWLFIVAIPVQAIHFLEHTIQLNQHVMGVRPAHGLLGRFFDTVGIHVAFNVGIFVMLLWMYLSWRSDAAGWKDTRSGGRWFTALIWFQAYHATEHVVQGYQAWVIGAKPLGMIGQWLPNVAAHYQLNLVLTLLMLVVFVKLQPRRLAFPG